MVFFMVLVGVTNYNYMILKQNNSPLTIEWNSRHEFGLVVTLPSFACSACPEQREGSGAKGQEG